MSPDKDDKITIVDGDWKVVAVQYFDLDEKADDIERFIIQLEHDDNKYNVVSFVFPDGGCVLSDKTPDDNMEPVEGKMRELAIKATIMGCCKLGIFIDVIATKGRMKERDKIIAKRNEEEGGSS